MAAYGKDFHLANKASSRTLSFRQGLPESRSHERFFPFGGDKEAASDFQLIAGTHRDLRQWVASGRFREDLYARINLWTFDLPGLAERFEDIEPNLEFELERYAEENNRLVRFNVEARRRYLAFAASREARWPGNFRELSASVTRMATLADAGRITEPQVQEEIARLRRTWLDDAGDEIGELLGEREMQLDPFDRIQLAEVVKICRQSGSLSEAGRKLYAVSSQGKKQTNDADRLRKYLARFGLDWTRLKD
jgi:transcriptional regulatory protein RtcR